MQTVYVAGSIPSRQSDEGRGEGDAIKSWKNARLEKKLQEKALIPLPPTGFVSLFSAKVEGGAIGSPAQAGCGLSQAFALCTECKVLQRNVMRLRCVLQRREVVPFPESPGPLGRKIGKPLKECVFKN